MQRSLQTREWEGGSARVLGSRPPSVARELRATMSRGFSRFTTGAGQRLPSRSESKSAKKPWRRRPTMQIARSACALTSKTHSNAVHHIWAAPSRRVGSSAGVSVRHAPWEPSDILALVTAATRLGRSKVTSKVVIASHHLSLVLMRIWAFELNRLRLNAHYSFS